MGHVCFLWKVKLVEEVECDNRVKLQKRNGGGRCIFKRESTFFPFRIPLGFPCMYTHSYTLTAALKHPCPDNNTTDPQLLSFLPYDTIILFVLLNLALT